jgi:hypothetical protein
MRGFPGYLTLSIGRPRKPMLRTENPGLPEGAYSKRTQLNIELKIKLSLNSRPIKLNKGTLQLRIRAYKAENKAIPNTGKQHLVKKGKYS